MELKLFTKYLWIMVNETAHRSVSLLPSFISQMSFVPGKANLPSCFPCQLKYTGLDSDIECWQGSKRWIESWPWRFLYRNKQWESCGLGLWYFCLDAFELAWPYETEWPACWVCCCIVRWSFLFYSPRISPPKISFYSSSFKNM